MLCTRLSGGAINPPLLGGGVGAVLNIVLMYPSAGEEVAPDCEPLGVELLCGAFSAASLNVFLQNRQV